ncbi:MAG: DUF1549 domain-containing protein [Planctomycetota bacterium]
MIALLLCIPGRAEETTRRTVADETEVSATARQRMIGLIDRALSDAWNTAGVRPAATIADHEFMRRACLDFTGVIPRTSQLRSFLVDERPEKRQQLLERLATSPRCSTHLATVWRNRILPAGAEEAHPRESVGLQKWLRSRFARNLRYDALVAGLLLATGSEELGPALYYQANDLLPEKLAASVSDVFLGMKLQCAQCHDHPFAEYSQRDFWGLAAFFAQVQTPEAGNMEMSFRLIDTNRGEVRLPDTEELVTPKYLKVNRQVDESMGSRRASLVLWLTSRDNPYFARAAVNWAWAHFFGNGLVDTLDQVGDSSDAINNRLLDDLADYFVDTGFDLHELMLTIAGTHAYQLSSWQRVPADADPHLFAYVLPRPLTPEQLYDSFVLLSPPVSVDSNRSIGASAPQQIARDGGLLRMQFIRQMREPPGNPTEYRAGTMQALMLMNGTVTSELTTFDRSRIVGALTAPFLDDDDRIATLFLAALSRLPTEAEVTLAQATLESSQSDDDRDRVLSDLLWAMVNSTEFAFNR